VPNDEGDAAVRRPRPTRRQPRTSGHRTIDFDVLEDLLSFYMRGVSLELNRDFDHAIAQVALAKGTGKTSVLLFVAANPGIRPSVIAHYIFKDRSAMARLLDQMEGNGLIVEVASRRERRARELYLTEKGQRLVDRVREIAQRQSAEFFAPLSDREQAQLLQTLKKLYRHRLAASDTQG
jgi:DNA-binding MarR family transcriptional regulator